MECSNRAFHLLNIASHREQVLVQKTTMAIDKMRKRKIVIFQPATVELTDKNGEVDGEGDCENF